MNLYVLIRYLVDMGWWKQWKKFVGYDTWNPLELNDPQPSPIDNSSLFASKTLHHLHDLYYFINHRH